MAQPIMMPQVEQDIEKVVILEWLVKENDHVNKGDIVAIIESEKAVFEIEADESGVILKILYDEGVEAKVLEPIAYIGEIGENIENILESDTVDNKKMVKTPFEEEQKNKKTDHTAESKVFASPSARRVAREHGVDITTVQGSGPRGRILEQDVLSFVAFRDSISPIKTPANELKSSVIPEIKSVVTDDTEIQFSKIRKRIADRLIKSKQTIPHFYLSIDIDMTAASVWRAAYNQTAKTKISFNDLIVKASAFALSKFPRLNAHVAEDKLVVRRNINIGVAVSTEEGLMVPVIPDVDQKDVQEISRLSQENAEGARRGVLKAQSVGTFTISNLGMYSVNYFIPIINPPECAILGVGSIAKRVIPQDNNGMIIRDMMTLTLACDHRAVDGTYAAQFLNTIKKYLEELIFIK